MAALPALLDGLANDPSQKIADRPPLFPRPLCQFGPSFRLDYHREFFRLQHTKSPNLRRKLTRPAFFLQRTLGWRGAVAERSYEYRAVADHHGRANSHAKCNQPVSYTAQPCTNPETHQMLPAQYFWPMPR